MGNTEIAFQLNGFLKKGESALQIVVLHLYIPKIGVGLRVLGIVGQLALEFLLRFLVSMRLPV